MGKKNDDDDVRRAIEDSGMSPEEQRRALELLARAEADENRQFDDTDQAPGPN